MPTTPAKTSKPAKSAAAKTTKKSANSSRSAAATRTRRAGGKDNAKSATQTLSKSASKSLPRRRAAAAPAIGAEAITNYTTALKWLYSHTDYERMRMVRYDSNTFDLGRTRKLLAAMGNPQKSLKAVQVAGTKGKGSTCAMLASMLRGCGYTVGLYTSPHLVDLRERIMINGNMISFNDVAEVFRCVAEHESVLGDRPPTFFEILTVAALKYFADQAVDIAVLETGLGGRLDSTTAANPLVTGITHISLDHTQWLGPDVASIAREKAGIFKKGVPAISVEQDPKAADVLREVADQVGAPLEFTGEALDFSYRFEASRELGPHTRVCLTTPTSRFEHLPVPLCGEHQALNCGLALAMLDKLKANDFDLPEDKVIKGLAATTLPGRMEQVWPKPRVIIDGAHNAHSIQALIRALGAHISYDSLVMIFGCGADKDVTGMLKQVALGADKVIFTEAKNNPRAMEATELIHTFSELTGKMAQTAPTLQDALKLAARAVSREDLIIVTGSFYLAGEARKYFQDAQAKRAKK